MNKNPIQEERIKGYFIQAAMEILRGEGIRDLSVRNVAEKAGYSYATLYNYFKDLNELLTVCITEFLNENEAGITSAVQYIPKGKQRLAVIYFTYIKYFVQYPGIFELTYFGKNKNSRNLILNFIENISSEDWNYLIDKSFYTKEEATAIKQTANYIVIGLLLAYNNLHFPDSYEKFQQVVKEQFTTLLEL